MKILHIVIGILYTLFGIYLWNHPAETLVTYAMVYGIIQLSGAIFTLIFILMNKIKPIPYGNIFTSLAIGLSIFCLPLFSLSVISWIFMFTFLMATIYHYKLVKTNKGEKWYHLQLALSILGMIYAIILLFNPLLGLFTIAKGIAFVVMINGISYMFVKDSSKK